MGGRSPPRPGVSSTVKSEARKADGRPFVGSCLPSSFGCRERLIIPNPGLGDQAGACDLAGDREGRGMWAGGGLNSPRAHTPQLLVARDRPARRHRSGRRGQHSAGCERLDPLPAVPGLGDPAERGPSPKPARVPPWPRRARDHRV